MHTARVVHIGQRLQEHGAELRCFDGPQPFLVADPLAERAPPTERHDEQVSLLVDVQDGHDVRMIPPTGDPCFLNDARAPISGPPAGVEDLEGDLSLDRAIPRAKDGRRPPAADLLEHRVPGAGRPRAEEAHELRALLRPC